MWMKNNLKSWDLRTQGWFGLVNLYFCPCGHEMTSSSVTVVIAACLLVVLTHFTINVHTISRTHTHTHTHTWKHTSHQVTWPLSGSEATYTVCEVILHPENNYINKRKVECVSVWINLVTDLFLTIFCFLSDSSLTWMGRMWAECVKHRICLWEIYSSVCVCVNAPHPLCLFQSDHVLVWCENHRRCAQVNTHIHTNSHRCISRDIVMTSQKAYPNINHPVFHPDLTTVMLTLKPDICCSKE